MELLTLSLISLAFVLLWLVKRKERTSFDSIPGPFRLPIFGNVQFTFPTLHKQFTQFAKQYGDLYRIQLLSQPAVVVNSYEIFKEAYSQRGKDFVGRPHSLRFDVIGASSGVAFRSFSEKQRDLRSKATRVLSLRGMSHLSSLINENVDDLMQLFDKMNGEAFDPRDTVRKFLINIILAMVFGEKADYNDPLVDSIIRFNLAGVKAATIGREDIDVWTWTWFFNPNYKLAVEAKKAFDASLLPLYQKYKETYIPGHERGAIDTYIQEVRNGSMTDEDVLGTLIDYFIGGVETTSATLYGFFAILLNHPKIQQKLQDDVDANIGQDRWPQVSDKSAVPYAEACIMELFRYQSALPLLVPRKAIRDTTLCGYDIPKGTWLYTNAWAIHHNEDIFSEPYTFKPERFLDDNGCMLTHDHLLRKNVVTFGLGARHCLGESLAKTRLFLTLCSLMQRFTLLPDESEPLPDCDARNYKLSIIFDVTPFKLRAIRRQA